MAEIINRKCELCIHQAKIYCPSDSAYLCTTCDNNVHRANFLVARHVRVRITCQSSSQHVHDDNDDCLSSSSSCISSTTTGDDMASSTAARVVAREEVVDERVEGIFVNWSRRMGVEERKVVRAAAEVVSTWRMDRMTVVPLRVVLAAALWVGIRVSGGNSGGGELLRRLEQISGVPVKLILIMGSRLARVVKCRRSLAYYKEGSAES